MVDRRIGAYEIVAKVGEGGMGEVYRARDTKLDRDVAIKILPESVATDPERIARFQREAKTLASLNHPNIAHIYGFEGQVGRVGQEGQEGQAGQAACIVMELVEGPTLDELIGSGASSQKPSALPVKEALSIARQIADALEAAHEQGIIHRDLKPANIKVRPDGTVKVLDFGLAKAMEVGAGAPGGTSTNLSMSPTLTSPAMTGVGMILGTAAYMSPEQAAGKAADKRSDLWSFGVVLMEMLTGRQLFAGETVSHVLASVLKDEPDWSMLPADTPAAVRRLLRRCLEKDRRRRLDSAAAAKLEIEDAISAPPAGDAVASDKRSRASLSWARAAVIAVTIVAALGVGAVVGVRSLRREQPAGAVAFTVAPPHGELFLESAMSPDGRYLVTVIAETAGQRQGARLWIRAMDTTDMRPLDGTENAVAPFWAPDSRAIGFFVDGKLKRVDVAGGPVQVVAEGIGPAGNGTGGSWSAEGTIVFRTARGQPLQRVPAAGGQAVRLRVDHPDGDESDLGWPVFLPDGRRFLGYAVTRRAVYLASLDGGAITQIVSADSSAVLTSGHLLFLRQGQLVAQPFDPDRGQVHGDATIVASQVVMFGAGRGMFTASQTGVLAYVSGLSTMRNQMTWVDRTGRVVGAIDPPGDYRWPVLSPDGTHVAYHLHDIQSGQDVGEVWTMDLERGAPMRLTFQGADTPAWSPDGSQVVFDRDDGIYRKAANGTGSDELIAKSRLHVDHWSPDGRFLVVGTIDANSRLDLATLPLEGDRKPVPLLHGDYNEENARLSPDGRWLAYQSDESKTWQVYVQTMPLSGGRWQISTTGGGQPRWRRDGKELYYLTPDLTMMAVDIKTSGNALIPGTPHVLFKANLPPPGDNLSRDRQYDVSADGSRFLLVLGPDTIEVGPVNVVVNWTSKLATK